MADDGDLKDVLARLAALEKKNAEQDQKLAAAAREFSDQLDLIGKTVDKLNGHIEAHEKDQKSNDDNFGTSLELIEKTVDKLNAHIDVHEKDQQKTNAEFLSQLKLIDSVVSGLQKQMTAPDKALGKDIDDLKGRVKDLEGKLAKMGKK